VSFTNKHASSTSVARSTPYDNATSELKSSDVQGAIDELSTLSSSTASPGYGFGRSGITYFGSYLLNESVPSNVTGRSVYLASAQITDISIGNEDVSTFSILIEEHDGVTFTTLITVNVVAARTAAFSVGVPVTTGKMLAVKIQTGSAKNPVVILQLRGSI